MVHITAQEQQDQVPEINRLVANIKEKLPEALLPIFIQGLQQYYVIRLNNIIAEFIRFEKLDFDLSITTTDLKARSVIFFAQFDAIVQQIIVFHGDLAILFQNLKELLQTYSTLWLKKVIAQEKQTGVYQEPEVKPQGFWDSFCSSVSCVVQACMEIPSYFKSIPSKVELSEQIRLLLVQLETKDFFGEPILSQTILVDKTQLAMETKETSLLGRPISSQMGLTEKIHELMDQLIKKIFSALAESKAKLLKSIQTRVDTISKQFSDTVDDEIMLLEYSQIVFASLSVCGRKTLQRLQRIFDILVIDEAGQAIQAETLIPFSLPIRKALLVGDPMQLPPTTFSQTADKTHFSESILARLMSKKAPHQMLIYQYRMHPEIRQFPSNHFYDGRLQDGSHIHTRGNPLSTIAHMPFIPYGFIDMASGQESPAGHSFYNKKECKTIAKLVNCIKTIDSSIQIGVITFYRAQVDKLKDKLSSYANVLVATVDGFQGGECDCIIISCVRANPKGNIGFARDFRRINVAITRARYGLVIFGHVNTLRQGKYVLSKLIDDAHVRQKLFDESCVPKVL